MNKHIGSTLDSCLRLTKQGVRDLGKIRSRRRPAPLPINCEHTRMKYASCEYCKKPCRVECIDCGFTWMFGEGTGG